MNIIIKKIDINQCFDVMNFLIEESFKLYRDLNSVINDDNKEVAKEKLKEVYLDVISDDDKIYVAYIDDEIVGCVYINKINYLSDLFVLEKYRNKKIGSMLLKYLINDIKEGTITLDTYEKCLSLYERFGFKKISISENNRIKMEKTI